MAEQVPALLGRLVAVLHGTLRKVVAVAISAGEPWDVRAVDRMLPILLEQLGDESSAVPRERWEAALRHAIVTRDELTAASRSFGSRWGTRCPPRYVGP